MNDGRTNDEKFPVNSGTPSLLLQSAPEEFLVLILSFPTLPNDVMTADRADLLLVVVVGINWIRGTLPYDAIRHGAGLGIMVKVRSISKSKCQR